MFVCVSPGTLLLQVYDKEVLPNFHYRDDGLLLYNAINTYVTKYVNLYYGKSYWKCNCYKHTY